MSQSNMPDANSSPSPSVRVGIYARVSSDQQAVTYARTVSLTYQQNALVWSRALRVIRIAYSSCVFGSKLPFNSWLMVTSRTQVFVTSDWHLGGSRDNDSDNQPKLGTSIFRSVAKLTSFLDSIHGRAEVFSGQTHLVLNGDIVDFLAPNPANSYSPIAWQNDATIIRKELDDIASRFVDENGRGPFAALRDVAQSGVQIFVLLGNHDVELCLPGIRTRFAELVGGSVNVRFIYDGEAYTCGKLIVEHGNQYDRFNGVDYDRLRRERSQLSRGARIEDSERGKTYFQPPVGSSIVVDEVNPRLADVPFLNLLKPEFGAAIPLMLAFYPETRKFYELAFVAGKIAKRASRNTHAKQPGLLAGAPAISHTDLNSFLREELADDAAPFLGPTTRPGQLSGTSSSSESLMSRLAKKSKLVVDLTFPWGLYTKLRTGNETERLKCVRVALKRVRDTADFATDSEKVEYREPAQAIIEQGGFEAVVFGHTHFPKEIHLDGGKYLNAGTWADVLRLPEAISSDDESEADAAVSTFLEDMRQQNYAPYTVRSQTYVEAIVDECGSVEASLKYYNED